MDINTVKTKNYYHNYVTIKQSDNTSPIELLLCGSDGKLISNLNTGCTVTLLDIIDNQIRQKTSEEIVNGVLIFKVTNDLKANEHRLEITTNDGQKFPSDGTFTIYVARTHDETELNIINNLTRDEALGELDRSVKSFISVNSQEYVDKAATAQWLVENKFKPADAVATFNDLPVTAELKELRLVVDENKQYIYDGTQWIEFGALNADGFTPVRDVVAGGVSIKAFGATGDGVTDDSDAFKRAVAEVDDNATVTLSGDYVLNDVSSIVGDLQDKKNITFKASGSKATIKIKPVVHSVTTNANITGAQYQVRDYYELLKVATNNWKIARLQLETGKIFEYIKVADKSQIPSSLKEASYIKGATTGVAFEVASIDNNDPDGAGTARIYLFEGRNNSSKYSRLKRNSDVLAEDLKLVPDLWSDRWLLDFGSVTVNTEIKSNRKITQTDGKVARIDKVEVYKDRYNETHNIVLVDSFAPSQLLLDKPLNDNIDFKIETYVLGATGFGSLNGWENVTFENIIFDGSNYEVGLKLLDGNEYNILYTYAVENLTLRDCIFNNAIAGAVHIGGADNAYAKAGDYPRNVTIDNCHFYNNGRNDIEIIHGSRVTISQCTGDGTLDVETNGDTLLDGIFITNCYFKEFTPYSPSEVSNSKIMVSNCVFFNLISQMGASSKIIGSYIHQLSTYNGNNLTLDSCSINRIRGVMGNAVTIFNHCDVYDLHRGGTGSQNIGRLDKMIFNACIIDLSLVNPDIDNSGIGYEFNATFITSFSKIVTVTRSLCKPSKFVLTKFNNIKWFLGNGVEKQEYISCEIKLKSGDFLAGDGSQLYVHDCFIGGSINLNVAKGTIINCILDSITKPSLYCAGGLNIKGLKSDNTNGIDWGYVRCATSPNKLSFNDVWVSTSIPNLLGIGNGFESAGSKNVSAGSNVNYCNSTTNYAAVIVHNGDGTLGSKSVSFS
ncbi:right-handed parallel beta-helix repeat-containing protein [Macrococcus bovicus]|uniref:right-handed parallel beta-helix repeat-containing protein n=1 Tax=Macrococcus bovicus TaxID=69968 RepID=UPI0025A51B13|nr:hypothetical protein [Macrococcus bovicus]WJP97057.1 hypothetical protein QSV55_07165 [Macrococcus bovicus]